MADELAHQRAGVGVEDGGALVFAGDGQAPSVGREDGEREQPLAEDDVAHERAGHRVEISACPSYEATATLLAIRREARRVGLGRLDGEDGRAGVGVPDARRLVGRRRQHLRAVG